MLSASLDKRRALVAAVYLREYISADTLAVERHYSPLPSVFDDLLQAIEIVREWPCVQKAPPEHRDAVTAPGLKQPPTGLV